MSPVITIRQFVLVQAAHAPPHPVNIEEISGMAVNKMVIPELKEAEQLSTEHDMPIGKLLTEPLPLPLTVIEILSVNKAVFGMEFNNAVVPSPSWP